MVDSPKRPRLVGGFIRQKREALGLSQRALGLLFAPPVTTQFISNLERGVTPLPPNHVPTLTKALQVNEGELMALLEREYAIKLSGRLGREGSTAGELPNGKADSTVAVASCDAAFVRTLYEAYRLADAKTRQAFTTVCESILNLPKGAFNATERPGSENPN
ncbi:MAG: helix-turn-helix transcriptional regulator [Oligoflexia bacterium]|nr:helix-turn-helix transcriptional regulator [Oligoflexia bacterium]